MTNYSGYDLDRMKLPELRKFAQSKGIKTSKRPKWVIINMILQKQKNPEMDVNNLWY